MNPLAFSERQYLEASRLQTTQQVFVANLPDSVKQLLSDGCVAPFRMKTTAIKVRFSLKEWGDRCRSVVCLIPIEAEIPRGPVEDEL